MKHSILELDLPPIVESLPVASIVSTEAALRWRIAKHAGSNPVPRDRPEGEPFEWVDETSPEGQD